MYVSHVLHYIIYNVYIMNFVLKWTWFPNYFLQKSRWFSMNQGNNENEFLYRNNGKRVRARIHLAILAYWLYHQTARHKRKRKSISIKSEEKAGVGNYNPGCLQQCRRCMGWIEEVFVCYGHVPLRSNENRRRLPSQHLNLNISCFIGVSTFQILKWNIFELIISRLWDKYVWSLDCWG